MDAALSGIVILDMATDVAGSYTCMLLGDMGAEVTKVELAGSPEWRGNPPFHLWNRGKKSISLDPNRPGARGVLDALISNGDVLVEDLLPGDALKRCLDYDTLSKLNARLLYCAIPPFGERGPMMNDPGDDRVVSAFSGVMSDQAGLEHSPIFIPVVRAETRDEFVEDPQVAHNGMMLDVHDPFLGATKQLGIPVKLSETPGHIKGPAPSKGENTEELLKGLGFSDSKIEELTSTGVVGRCGD